MPGRHLLRQLPAVDALLRQPGLKPLWAELGPAGARAVIVEVLAGVRRAPSAERLAGIEAELRAAASRRRQPSLRPVINATGVILHTNLGRAPLAAAAAARLAEVASSYSNLEYDTATGKRARRDRHLDALLGELTGAEATLVVNNNAAAVLLAVHTLGLDPLGEVLVSRGELVEIGESFRIADIISRGGARLIEVGATNRTRLADYQAARTPRTRLVLRVHRSNFTMAGFVEQPALPALAAWAHRHRLPLVEDLGSGCLAALPGLPACVSGTRGAAALGPAPTIEPTVRASLRAGADLVTYSGDKLLGGPQAGFLSGRAALVARLRANPLFRALRVDKLTLAALEATLAACARGEALPLQTMIQAPDLEARVRAFAAQLPVRLGARMVTGVSLLGGGSLPGHSLPAWLVTLPGSWAERLRRAQPPIIARIERGRCLIDLRTVFPHQEAALLQALLD